MTKQVLFHVDETEKWTHVVQNVHNMLAFYEAQNTAVAVEVLVNGGAVGIVLQPDAVRDIGKLTKKGVTVALCNNALKAFEISREQVPGDAVIVPAGVVEIAERQFEGYAYIKP